MHESGLERLPIIIPDQVEHPVGHEQVQLERDRYPQARRLAPGGLGGDDDFAEDGRVERERQDIRPAAYPAEAGVQPPDLGVVDEGEVALLPETADGRQCPARGEADTVRRDPDEALAIGQRDRAGGGQPALPGFGARIWWVS